MLTMFVPTVRDTYKANIHIVGYFETSTGIEVPLASDGQTSLGKLGPGHVFELYISIQKKNTNAVIECMINVAGIFGVWNKMLHIHYNRENFRKLLDLIARKWAELKLNHELHVLQRIAAQGIILTICMIIYLTIPLIFPVLDIVLPLNETRARLQIFKINYLIIDNDEYFYVEYLHLTCGTIVLLLTIFGVDSLYIMIIHHSSGLFDLTGHQIKKAMDTNLTVQKSFSDKYVYEQVKRSAITYNEAIQFYDILREISESLYIIQISLSMVGTSVSAFQTVINMDQPQEMIKCILIFISEQLHLLFISLVGQILLNHSSELEKQIYDSEWYRCSKKTQRMIHIMQIRSSKPCILTAGGIYKVNLESFRSTFKTCMSYCTMLLSVEQ
ncbi:PREDICTED: odorant receptor 67b-like [Eufriesea mexicana]|uniref:odorant receptor 67b-like n=1 Tax=Eufriesea mexicana TaxID=516756 RepID=UPI00083C1418|nr:PREDICTED: odorant receptor 67b-like [Eufriesea mexicana]